MPHNGMHVFVYECVYECRCNYASEYMMYEIIKPVISIFAFAVLYHEACNVVDAVIWHR
jgi:hypothetical protein